MKTNETLLRKKNLFCFWTDIKNNLIQYRILKFYVRHGLVVEKTHEIISFEQQAWLKH